MDLKTEDRSGPLRVWAVRLTLVALMVLCGVLVHRGSNGDAAAEVAFGYVLYAGLILWAWHLCQRGGLRLRDVIGEAPADRREWAWVGLAIPIIAFEITAVIGIYYALSWVAPGFVETELLAPDEPSLLAGRPMLAALELATVVLLGPIAEELFFRGALVHRWTARWGPRVAAGASAALFGALHADPIGGVVFGLCMTLVYLRTGTLLVPMACHALHNAALSAPEILSPEITPTGETLAEFREDAVWITLALPLTTAALALAVRGLQRRLPKTLYADGKVIPSPRD